ncbi:hypothetical protein C5C03_07000 [Clavibacter michiganensis]|uniref:hypothetical protein n=1 Tax=Clavibacter michiganensis TaxID=28447 RepID=UPI000CE933DB|nr:hypothetical protein [Clavibacter michiganensis]PPF88323.1 hypothetical protein C5C03_07000 [Clavibacter michiganensis]PPF92601.1 hypothetical protein C5C05_14035 [Clavibacter michiganensis]
MQWWNDLLDALASERGTQLLSGVVVPFVAIVVAGVLAAVIARGATQRILTRHDREVKAAAIGVLVDAARQASVWDGLTAQERVLADRAAGEADIRIRLLPVKGAATAATWAAHEITEFKRGSGSFGFQFDAQLAEFRDRMVEWQHHPGRSRKIFQGDISRWQFEDEQPADTTAGTRAAARPEEPTAVAPVPVPWRSGSDDQPAAERRVESPDEQYSPPVPSSSAANSRSAEADRR